jgi:hypothetical protein
MAIANIIAKIAKTIKHPLISSRISDARLLSWLCAFAPQMGHSHGFVRLDKYTKLQGKSHIPQVTIIMTK